MKNKIIIFIGILIVLCLAMFSFANDSKPETTQSKATPNLKNVAVNLPALENSGNRIFSDFIYDVGPRFGSIKKHIVDKATSIDPFLDEDVLQSIVNIKSVSIIVFKDEKRTNIREIGYSSKLTFAQLKLLHSFDYSTNFLIQVDFQEKNSTNDKLHNNYSSPYLTIVPESQAEYALGKKALKEYLKESSKEARLEANVEVEKLQPAKLFFTVTKKGTIDNVRLDRTSNYPLVDKTMIELIKKAPGTWNPAKNIKGEKVDQELVVSFGLIGC